MEQWFSIEVLDGRSTASQWADAFGDDLVTSALGFGAQDWSWHSHTWGVVLEVRFPNEAAWDAWRESLTVQRALDSVPDPVSGLIVYKGRGGSSGRVQPRKPRPLSGSGAAALPLPLALEDIVFPERQFVLQSR
jgi:hypothetical protein